MVSNSRGTLREQYDLLFQMHNYLVERRNDPIESNRLNNTFIEVSSRDSYNGKLHKIWLQYGTLSENFQMAAGITFPGMDEIIDDSRNRFLEGFARIKKPEQLASKVKRTRSK